MSRSLKGAVPPLACVLIACPLALGGCQAGGGENARGNARAQGSSAGSGEIIAAADPAGQLSAAVAAELEKADAAYESGQWVDAADAYAKVLEVHPGNARAESGLTASLTRLDSASRIDEVLHTHELRYAVALAEFDAGYQRSLQALENNQFELAKGAILQARATLFKGRMYIPEKDFESRDAKAAELLKSIDAVWELHVRSGG